MSLSNTLSNTLSTNKYSALDVEEGIDVHESITMLSLGSNFGSYVETLGQGSYGKVVCLVSKETKEHVAVKIMSDSQYTPQESLLMKKLNKYSVSPKLIKTVYLDDGRSAIIMKYYPLDLKKYYESIQISAKLPTPEVISQFIFQRDLLKSYFRQLLNKLKIIHDQGIYHLDIKPSNLLIDRIGNLVITDFGNSTTNTKNKIGRYLTTIMYCPPECILNPKFKFYGEKLKQNPLVIKYHDFSSSVPTTARSITKVDVWSAACTIMELILGEIFIMGDFKDEFSKRNEKIHITQLFSILGKPSFEEAVQLGWVDNKHDVIFSDVKDTGFSVYKSRINDDLLYDLLSKMLILNPKERISVEEALTHKYFTNVDA